MVVDSFFYKVLLTFRFYSNISPRFNENPFTNPRRGKRRKGSNTIEWHEAKGNFLIAKLAHVFGFDRSTVFVKIGSIQRNDCNCKWYCSRRRCFKAVARYHTCVISPLSVQVGAIFALSRTSAHLDLLGLMSKLICCSVRFSVVFELLCTIILEKTGVQPIIQVCHFGKQLFLVLQPAD